MIPFRLMLLAAALVSACALEQLGAAAAPSGTDTTATTATHRVEFELIGATQATAISARDWAKLLTELGANGVRVSSSGGKTQPKIDTLGGTSSSTYKVTGAIDSRGDLVVPGGRFSLRNRQQLAEWIEKLRAHGPAVASGAPIPPFGLAPEQLEKVRADLATKLSTTTAGKPLRDILDDAAEAISIPMIGDPAVAPLLAAAPPIDNELQGFATGTALAYALEQNGLALVPRADAKGDPQYVVRRVSDAQERWPVGHAHDRTLESAARGLLDRIDAEIKDQPILTVVDAICKRVELPYLVDRAACKARGIDLDKSLVTIPAKKTFYDNVLNRSLFQARLKKVVLLDDAARPFVWITPVTQGNAESTRAQGR